MGYIKQYDKRSGITYVYENHPYWDKEKKTHRARRHLVGRLDPETGQIIPTDGRCRKLSPTDFYDAERDFREEYERLLRRCESQQVLIESLQEELRKKSGGKVVADLKNKVEAQER